MISNLTKEQELDLQNTINKWLDIGRSTERLNKPAVVKSITNLYKANGNKKPMFWFCDSPLQCSLAMHLFKNNLGNNLANNLLHNLRDNLANNLNNNLRNNLANNLENNLENNLRNNLRNKIANNLRNNLENNLESNIRDMKFENYFGGSQWCYWNVFYDFCNKIGVPYNDKDKELLSLWIEQSKECYWWFPFENIVFCSERPIELNLDKDGKLHHNTKPAISFADGYKLYSIHGIIVPSWIVEYPEQITKEKIKQEKNETIKQIMFNRIGFDNNKETLERYLDLLEV